MRKLLFTALFFSQFLPSFGQDCSIEALATLTTELWATEVSYTISDDNGSLLSGDGFGDYGSFTTTFCLDNVSGCLVLNMVDSFGDGWNGAALYITVPSLGISLGTFTLDDGKTQTITFGTNCETEEIVIEGCTDPMAFNYDLTATIDDGSCEYDCMCDDLYEPVCGYDFTTQSYNTYNNLCEAECAQAYSITTGDCDSLPVLGCTNIEATNFNPNATTDDGSCIVVPECEEFQNLAIASLSSEMWSGEVSFTISSDNGILAQGQGVSDYDTTATYFCMPDSAECLTLDMYDSFGDGWNGATLSVTLSNQNLSLGTFTLNQGNFQSISIGLDCESANPEGCTDPSATNYNELATVDDGSCNYNCDCDDVYQPVCAVDLITGELITYQNSCEAECAQAIILSDGDCDEQPILGCTDPESLNYNSEATDDDGSCLNDLECGDDDVTVLVALHTAIWGSEVSFEISDTNGNLTEGQGLNDDAVYFTSFCLSDSSDCLQLQMMDSFGDGWNGATLDVSIPSQNLSLGTFTLESGNHQTLSFGVDCEITEIETEGCTDPIAFNYNPYATIDNGSCSYECECAEIYDPVCGYDYLTGGYITFNNACEASCEQAYIVWEGDCTEQPIYGCTEEEALNYNENATIDDGSCVTIPTCGTNETTLAIEVNLNDSIDDLGYGISWSLTDSNGLHVNLVYDYTNWQASNAYGCLDDGCYNFFMYDYGWGLNLADVDVTIGGMTTTYTFEDGELEAAYAIGVNTEECELFIPVYGCTDTEAMNYNPEANIDDGYCLYPCECEEVYDPVCAFDYYANDYITFNNICEAECWNAWIVWDGDCADQPIYGCTSSEALNYNPEATVDDASCVYIPICEENEIELIIQTTAVDSLDEFGGAVSLHWSLTTDLGQHVNLVYDYNEFQTISYGCVADGCYNFYLNDFGWTPGMNSVEVFLGEELSTFSVPAESYSEVFAFGVGVEGCEVTIPGCTDPEALNYYAAATIDDGNCQYPFICETGEVGYVYLYSPIINSTLSIISENGELVFSGNDLFNFGGVYGEVCLEQNTCYTAIVSGVLESDSAWTDGVLGISTSSQDVVYTEWPVGENNWATSFSIDGSCAEDNWDWEQYLGCTDSEASNYNPDALVDDDSCLYGSLCNDLFEVEFVLYGGLNPEEVGLNVSNDAGDMLMEMNGYTGSSVGCVPEGCYTVEMIDSSGDGWEEAMAELYVDGEYVDFMTLEQGSYEMRVIGLGIDCQSIDEETVSIEEESSTENWTVQLFPNPGKDLLSIYSSNGFENSMVEIKVFNIDGRMITDLTDLPQDEKGNRSVDVSSWSSGIYLIEITQNNQTKQLKWVKMR